jgi:hypothetical protein
MLLQLSKSLMKKSLMVEALKSAKLDKKKNLAVATAAETDAVVAVATAAAVAAEAATVAATDVVLVTVVAAVEKTTLKNTKQF